MALLATAVNGGIVPNAKLSGRAGFEYSALSGLE